MGTAPEGKAQWLPKQNKSPSYFKVGSGVPSVWGVVQRHPDNLGQQLHKQQLAPRGGGMGLPGKTTGFENRFEKPETRMTEAGREEGHLRQAGSEPVSSGQC